MTKIVMMVSRADLDAPVAEHFGKANWILVVESQDRRQFLRRR